MNRSALSAVVATVLLMMAQPGAAATVDNPVIVESDSAAGGWTTTQPESGASADIVQTGDNRFTLVKNNITKSDYYLNGDFISTDLERGDRDGDSQVELIDNRRSFAAGELIEDNLKTDRSSDSVLYGGGASNENGYYSLVAGSTSGCLANDCWELKGPSGNTIKTGGGKQVAGMAFTEQAGTLSDTEFLIIGDRSSKGTTQDDFLMYNPSNGNQFLLKDTGVEFEVAGIAQAQKDAQVWIIDKSDDELERLRIVDSQNVDVLEVKSLPSELSGGVEPSGLAHVPGTDIFAAYNENDDEAVIFRKDGTVITTFSRSNNAFIGAIARNDRGYNINNGAFYLSETEYGTVDYYSISDLSVDSPGSYTTDKITALEGVDTEIAWTFGLDANIPSGSYTAQLEVRTDEIGWTQYGQVSVQNGVVKQRDDLNKVFQNADWYQVRVTMDPGKKHPITRAWVQGGATYAAFYSPGGQNGAVVTDQIDAGDVETYHWLNLTGAEQTITGNQDSTTSVEVVDTSGQVVESTTVDLSADPKLKFGSDISIPTNQFKLRFILNSQGLTRPVLSGWNLTYERENPTITSTSVTDNGTTYEDTSRITSAIGNTTTHTVEDVTAPIDEVVWYKNGEQVTTKTGSGKFQFSESWAADETGVNTITAEVYNTTRGTDEFTWTIEVPEPRTVSIASVSDVIQNVGPQVKQTRTTTRQVEFVGDVQTVTGDLATAYLVVRPQDDAVTYDLTVNTTGPISSDVAVTNHTGVLVTRLTDTYTGREAADFSGRYEIGVGLNASQNSPTTTYDIEVVAEQQFADIEGAPIIESADIPTQSRVGDTLTASASITTDVKAVRSAWVRVEYPNGTVERRAVQTFTRDTGQEVNYSAPLSLDSPGRYSLNIVAESYDERNTSSRTFVVDVTNAPPTGDFQNPPLEVDANRSFGLNWSVSDPDGHAIAASGVLLEAPDGTTVNLTGTATGTGYTVDVPQGAVTLPDNRAREQWALNVWATDTYGASTTSARTFVDVVSRQQFGITNVSVQRFDGQGVVPERNARLHASRETTLNAVLTPDISSTVNGTVFVRVKTQSGAVEQDLYTATDVRFENGTSVSLAELNNGTVDERLAAGLNGTQILEIGVTTPKRDDPVTYQTTVNVTPVTNGRVEGTQLSTGDVSPPQTITATSTIRNTGERPASYEYRVAVVQNGSTVLTESVTTGTIRPGDTGSVGLPLDLPKTVTPGNYTVDITVASPTYNWRAYDADASQLQVSPRTAANVDKVDLTYTRGVVQGYITVQNDGNQPLPPGKATIVVEDNNQRIRVVERDVGRIGVGSETRLGVNFNLSAQQNTTYTIRIAYESEVADLALSQVATAPQPSMGIVDIDGPQKVVQGQNATFEIVVKNNGQVPVDSSSLVAQVTTRGGDIIAETGAVVDTTRVGSVQTVRVELPFNDASLLGVSQVKVFGQASRDGNSTQMLPRNEDVFVSAPGFIISGDNALSGLDQGQEVTITETFLVVDRPSATVDVSLDYNREKLTIVCQQGTGEECTSILNQTVTSGDTLSYTFIVEEPLDDPAAITLDATSNGESRTKRIGVSSKATGGAFGGTQDEFPSSFGEAFPNTWTSQLIGTNPYTIHIILQGVVALPVVIGVWVYLPVNGLTRGTIAGIGGAAILGAGPWIIYAAVVGGVGVGVYNGWLKDDPLFGGERA